MTNINKSIAEQATKTINESKKELNLDFKNMEKTVAENNQKKSEQFRNGLKAITDNQDKKRAADQQLFNKALSSMHKEEEEKRAIELEKEKAKALDKVEAKYEKRGVKSSKTQSLDSSYRSMLGNIRGLED